MPSLNDPIYYCEATYGVCPVGETDTGKRVHRVVVGTGGEWNIGDTIVINLGAVDCRLFGYPNLTPLASNIEVTNSSGGVIAGTTSGQGSVLVTYTLTAAGPAGDTISVRYCVGCPGTYRGIISNRGNTELDIHGVSLAPVLYAEVFGRNNQFGAATMITRSTALLAQLQSDPPV